MTTDQDQPIDGRLARSQRARAAIIKSVMELLEEGNMAPSAQAVAERAGVSLRLVFHHFKDMESLFTEMFAAMFQLRILPHLPFPTGDDGTFQERLELFVHKRAALYEAIGPLRRAGELKEHESAAITGALDQGRVANAVQVITAFSPELDAQPEDLRTTLTSAVVMATSFPAWDTMRRHQGLSVDDAKKVFAETLRRLLRLP
ncbi:MAG TPA: helix-turn-helix domain-containing protein [Myxococcaceae bacterium]|jgi:AcrR family transcriptional regulator